MTLVARLAIKGFPILVADILLSGPEVAGVPLEVPTIGDSSAVFPVGSGFVPSGLSQKIAVLGDNLVIGWAGSVLAARGLVRELRSLTQSHSLSNDDLKRYLESVDSVFKNHELELAGFIRDGNEIRLFAVNSIEFSSRTFGRVGLLGSGASHAEEYIKKYSCNPELWNQGNLPEFSVALTLQMTGLALCFELATSTSLLHFYGGGYEIATLIDGRFQKLDDITYMFWFGEITKGELKAHLHHVSKYKYADERLLIRKASVPRSAKDPQFFAIREAIDVIYPVDRERSVGDLQNLPAPCFNSKWICNYFLFPSAKRGLRAYVTVQMNGRNDSPVMFSEGGQQLSIEFNQEWLNGVLRKAYDEYE